MNDILYLKKYIKTFDKEIITKKSLKKVLNETFNTRGHMKVKLSVFYIR